MKIKTNYHQITLCVVVLFAFWAQAEEVTSVFESNGQLTADRMNEIKDAVNDNDARTKNIGAQISDNVTRTTTIESRITANTAQVNAAAIGFNANTSLITDNSTQATAECGHENESLGMTSQQGDKVQFRFLDSLFGSRVDGNRLSARVTYGGKREEMEINDTDDSARVTFRNIPTGSVTFAIVFTNDFGGTILTLAEASKDFNVSEGSTNPAFAAGEYGISHDGIGDNISNVIERDETSNSVPTDNTCFMGNDATDSTTLNNCVSG